MQKIYNYFLSRYKENDFAVFTKAKLTLHFCLITAFFSVFYTFIANLIDFGVSAKVMPSVAILLVGLALLMRSKLNLNIISNSYLLISFIAALILIVKSGMIFSSITPWLAFIPMAANLLIGKRSATLWLIVCIVTVFTIFYLSPGREDAAIAYNPDYDAFFYAIVINGLIVIILVLSMIYQKSKDKYLALLEEKNDLISGFNYELKSKNDEIIAQNEELVQQKEEILAQREFIEMRNTELIKVQEDLNNIIDKLTFTQNELENREAKNKSILNAMYGSNLLVAEIDNDGKFIKVNPLMERYFGSQKDKIPGKTWNELFLSSKTETNIDFDHIWKEICKGHHQSIELPWKIVGKNLLIKKSFFPIHDERGKVTNIMLVGQDISQIQNQKEEIESLNKELTKKIKEIEKQNIVLLSQRKEIEAINKEIKQHNKEIRNINASLEKRVRKRTKNLEKKNKQLAEYAYINSHLLRGPLCSILGLVNLMESNSKKDHELILMHMKKSSDELHEVVKKITEAIEDGSHFDRELLLQN